MNALIRYFDLQSPRRGGIAGVRSEGTKTFAPVIPQYIALVLGILIQPIIQGFHDEHQWVIDFSKVTPMILPSFLIAIVIFPAIYKNAYDPNRPILVQLCSIVASGLGWQTLVGGLLSATTGS